MSNIDKHAVQAVADLKAGYTLGHADVAILKELARIALASLEVEAVAYADPQSFDNFKSMGGKNAACTKEWMWRDSGDGLIPVYTAPPAPVSDEDLLHMAASAIDDLLSNKDRSGAGVWADIPAKLRRAAMLQGADGNSPVIPDGWVACSERMPVENDIVLVVDDGYFVCEAQYREGDFYSAVRGGGEFFETTCRDVELWKPMPAAPQQEA